MDKDQFVEFVKSTRKFLASDEEAECPCPKTKCEWLGKCYECVRLHRHSGNHVPNCLQFILEDKVREIARAAEMTVEKKPMTPPEYWDQVNAVAPPDKEDA